FSVINLHVGASSALEPLLSALPRLRAAVIGGSFEPLVAAGGAHVVDAEDLLVLPCVLVPLSLARPRALARRVVPACLLFFVLLSRPGVALAELPDDWDVALRVDVYAGAASAEQPNDRGEATYVLGAGRLGLDARYRRLRFGAFGLFVH